MIVVMDWLDWFIHNVVELVSCSNISLNELRGRVVDTAGFNVAMDKQRAAARAAWAGSGDAATDKIWFDIRDRSGATDFLGYDREDGEAVVQAIIVNGEPVDKIAF